MRYEERRIVGGVAALLWLCASAGLAAQCDTLSGQVRAGSSFERAFGDGLLFRLRAAANAPPNPAGWTVEVRDGADGEHDFVWVATPPYRWWNPRYLDTSYGQTAPGAVARDVRTFGFVTDEDAYARLSEAVGFLVFSRPPEMTEAEYEAAHDSVYARWQAMMERVGRGQLRITDADVSEPTPDHPRGRIERLAFTVTLCPGGEEPWEGGDSGGSPRSRGVGPPGKEGAPHEGAPQDGPPGRDLPAAEPVPVDDVGRSCVDLASPEAALALSDSVASRTCEVTDAGPLARTGTLRWRWALYRHVSIYAPTERTPERDLELFPDTIREDELVLFAGEAEGDRTRPVWHDRTDARFHLLRPPRATQVGAEGTGAGSSVFLVHRRCLSGTGGCDDHPFRLEGEGRIAALERADLRALERELPPEWGTWKGVWIDSAGPAARAGVYLPGDSNCCPAFRVRLPLELRGDRLAAEAVRLEPDTSHAFGVWTIDPSGERFGPVRVGSSEADLRQRIGDSQVERADVGLAEGRCTVGARLFPGTPWEVEVAWSDSSRSRPAFARASSRTASSDRAPDGDAPRSPYRTPAGVGPGTSLETLSSIAGEPVRVSGFGWDFGGRVSWTVEGGELILYLALDRGRLEALRAAGDTARLEELFGDRTVASDHPLLDRLGVRVVAIGRHWRPPEAARFCG